MHTAQAEECQIEIVNGREEIRNLGEYEHSSMQTMLLMMLMQKDKERGTRTLVEQTIQINPDTRRIPDVAVFLRTTPTEPVFTEPPVTVIEILSREDRIVRYEERIDDYRQMGVKYIYVIDPHTQKAWNVSDGSWVRADRIRIHEQEWWDFFLTDLFAALKEHEA